MQQCTGDLIIQVWEATETVRPHTVNRIACDIILDKSWLSETSPGTDWKSNSTKLSTGGKFITLDAENSSMTVLIKNAFSWKTGRQVVEKAKLQGLSRTDRTIKKEKDLRQSASNRSERLVENYNDVFPDKLPNGLPPARNVEMSIDIEPNSKPTTGSVYTLSVKGLTKPTTQLKSAISKGLITPSISR